MKNAHGRTCKRTKVYFYLYISLYENLFENGCIFIYICLILLKGARLVFAFFNTVIARVQASVAEKQKKKKTGNFAVLLGVSGEPRPRPIRGWVAALFSVRTKGIGRGDFVTLIRVLCQKAAVQSQRIFPVA